MLSWLCFRVWVCSTMEEKHLIAPRWAVRWSCCCCSFHGTSWTSQPQFGNDGGSDHWILKFWFLSWVWTRGNPCFAVHPSYLRKSWHGIDWGGIGLWITLLCPVPKVWCSYAVLAVAVDAHACIYGKELRMMQRWRESREGLVLQWLYLDSTLLQFINWSNASNHCQ